MTEIALRSGREKSVLRRHPWIFSGAVASGVAGLGEIVRVRSAKGETLGYGCFSPDSQIRVRMISFGEGPAPDEKFISNRVRESVERRRLTAPWMFSEPETGCPQGAARLVNAEADGLPGVVADCYAGWVVCQFTSTFAESWKSVIAEALAGSVPNCKGVSARSDVEVRRKEGLSVSDGLEILSGSEPPEVIEIAEGPARFLVDVRKGHKTGFYLDQRDARAAVGALAKGREVLNCFCYTGGFGIYAAVGGASKVTQVDVSSDALALAARNLERTRGASAAAASAACEVEQVEADVFKYLRECRDRGRKFGMIVLDPPKFAETKSQLDKAARGYKDINLLAMKLLDKDGILATFSCSGAMDAEFFDTILAEAAQDARRGFQVVGRTGHAADHPVSLAFPEGRYLKGVILRAI